ncbi:MAG: hypothetical protein AB1521_00705 [Bacteroidota bacterium]
MNQIIYKMDLLVDSKETLSKNDIDTFILAAGSDYRAYESLRKMRSFGVQVKNLLIFHFNERINYVDKEDSYFQYKEILDIPTKEITCTIKNPASCLSQVFENSSLLQIKKNIALDISCFTKPYFFYLIKLLKGRFDIHELNVFYTEPRSYLFPRGVYSYYQSSTGPLSILEIPGFSGYERRGDKRILVILLGFDADLSKEINEDISPKETIVVNSFPGYIPKFKDISLVVNEKLTTNKDIKLAYSRADNPFEVFNLLELIKSKYQNTFLNIAPLGTKPMALGVCLFAMQYSDVRVIYPFPESYKKITTNNCWNSWQYKIPLLFN